MEIKNILVLTNLYPAPDLEKENTPVVHYFTRQWVNMGYNVLVMHYPTNFPNLVMKIASLFKKQISAIMPATIRTTPAKEMTYLIEGVKVKRIPLLKYKYHSRYSKRRIAEAFEKTSYFLETNNFIPDVILSHWANPTLEISFLLKKKYGCKTSYVSHFAPEARVYCEDSSRLIGDLDIIGFRSEPIKRDFLKLFSYKGPLFQCYSGIPKVLIPETYFERKFESINSFVFVGTLIKRKYPAEIVPSVYKVMKNADYTIMYIGKGAEEKRIKRYAKRFGIQDKVSLLGYQPRKDVVKHMRMCDVFIMNSKNEAFGLVYLEAMAQGCITIASKGEGFDGIIEDGVNGFLCNAGDINDLANTIQRIKKMSSTQLKAISKNAYETAKNLTDERAAQLYIDEIKKL